MKFAFYIEPYRIFHSHFYTYRILGDKFKYGRHTFDYYTPINYKIDSLKNSKMKIDIPTLHKHYGINFNIGFPEPEEYDVLLLESQYYKSWCDTEKDMRTLLAAKFSMHKKIIIVLNDSMLMETRLVSLNNIIYGTSSAALLRLDNKYNRIISHFSMPPVNYLINPKPSALTKEMFYAKYNLDPDLKIVAFLPGKLDKWRKCIDNTVDFINFKQALATKNFHTNNKQIHWFFNNYDTVIKAFKNVGYQIVGKMHIGDFNTFKKEHKYSDALIKHSIPYIQQQDLYELLQYSNYALTFGSTMVYQTYLYDLPAIEIGTGFYFPGWAYPDTEDFSYMEYIQKFNFGKQLIYGHTINFNKFTYDVEAYIMNIIKQKYDVNNFTFKENNPIYGNSYGKTIDTIYKNVIKISIVMYLKQLKQSNLNNLI